MSRIVTNRYLIIIKRQESVWESWARDASTFVLFLALIGIGVVLNSSAMQWIGAIIGFVTTLMQAAGLEKDHRYDLKGAQAALDKIKAEVQPEAETINL